MESWQALRRRQPAARWALSPDGADRVARKCHRAVRLATWRKPVAFGTSKSAVSRRFVALSRKTDRNLVGTRPASHPIDGLACRRPCPDGGESAVDGNGDQACPGRGRGGDWRTRGRRPGLDPTISSARGLDPTLPRLFIVDCSKALSKAILTFGGGRRSSAAGRTRAVTIERLPQHLHASVGAPSGLRTRTTQTRPSGSCATWSRRLNCA